MGKSVSLIGVALTTLLIRILLYSPLYTRGVVVLERFLFELRILWKLKEFGARDRKKEACKKIQNSMSFKA